jgi:hypothetical protein
LYKCKDIFICNAQINEKWELIFNNSLKNKKNHLILKKKVRLFSEFYLNDHSNS